MNINGAFPSNYLKAADLNGKTARVAISRVVTEDIGGDHKPVMYFKGKEKGMVLNKTNATNIAMAYGYETDDWIGGEIELFPTMVDFQGRSVEAIRVKVPPRRPAAATAPATATVAPNARDRAAGDWQAPPAAQPATAPAYDNGFDDEVPF